MIVAPFLGFTENLARTAPEVMNGFPREITLELSTKKALQLFPCEFAKLPLAESWNDIRVECVPIVPAGCVLECRAR